MNKKIAIITSIFNPSEEQICAYIKSLESFRGIPHKRYAAIKSSTKNINILIRRLKKYNVDIKIFNDCGTDDALNNLMHLVKEDFIWMLHCGDLLVLNNETRAFIKKGNLDSNTIYFGVTHFCEGNTIKTSNSKRFNLFYKYKIPILNLISCLIPSSLLKKSGGFKQNYKVAGDYDLILRLYNNNPQLKFLNGFPNLKFRNFFYFFYVLRSGFSPITFFKAVASMNSPIFEYIKLYGFQPYSDKKNSAHDLKYLSTLKHHYLESFKELDEILAKNPFFLKFLELGSHLALNCLYARTKNLEVTSSDLYKLGKYSKYRMWLKKQKIDYISHDLTSQLNSSQKYDCIYFHETLEHIPYNPVRVLRNVHLLLNKNGILNITVPNFFSLKNIYKILKLRHPYIIPDELIAVGSQAELTGNHWIEYDKKLLIKFLEASNYKIISHKKMVLNYGNLGPFIIKKIINIILPFIYDQHRIIAVKI